jgi:hypothetical protein
MQSNNIYVIGIWSIIFTYCFVKGIIAMFKYQRLWKSYLSGEYVPLSIVDINKDLEAYFQPQKQSSLLTEDLNEYGDK